MNTVMNLIKMDLRKLMSIGKILIFVTGAVLILSTGIQMSSVSFMLGIYMWVYSPWSYDEQNKGEYLTSVLPVKRETFVLAKYAYSFFGLCCILIINGMGRVLMSGMTKGATNPPFSVLFLFGAVFIAVALPVILYLGITKSRYVIMLCYIAPMILAPIGLVLLEARGAVNSQGSFEMPFSIWLVPLGIAVMALSFLVGKRFYARREF